MFLIAIVFPSGVGANMTMLLGGREKRSLASSLMGMVTGYALISLLAIALKPEAILIFNAPTHWLFNVAAPLFGIGCILVEYVVGMLLYFLKTRKLATRVAIHVSIRALNNSRTP